MQVLQTPFNANTWCIYKIQKQDRINSHHAMQPTMSGATSFPGGGFGLGTRLSIGV